MGFVVTNQPRESDRKSGGQPPHSKLVAAAAAATTTATATAGGTTRRRAGASRGEDGKLNGGFFAGTLGTGDFLLLVDDDFFETLVAGIADVFVDGHGDEDLSTECRGQGRGGKLRL